MRVLYGENRRLLANRVIQEVADDQTVRPFTRGFILVPEQQKAGMERRFFAMHPDRSLMLKEVLSFRRFAFRLAELGGGQARNVMTAGLQTFRLGRILAGLEGQLQQFNEALFRPSFLSMISEVIGDFLRYNVSPAMLRETAQRAEASGQERFSGRMNDYALLLETYLAEMTTDNQLPGDLVLDDLARRLEGLYQKLAQADFSWKALQFPDSEYAFLEHTRVWIHGFGESRGLTPQESRIVSALQRLCAEVVLTVESDTLPELYDPAEIDRGPAAFRPGRHMLWQLQQDFGQVSFQHLPVKSKALQYSFHRFVGSRDEVRWVAGEIRRLLVEDRVMPAEIGIALADGGLASEMQQALRELKIPVYTADALLSSQGAFQRLLPDVAKILRFGWQRDYLMPVLRNPYLGLAQDECDLLENYWLARGMKGPLIWDATRYQEHWQPQVTAPVLPESPEDEDEDFSEEKEISEQDRPVPEAMLAFRDKALRELKQLYEATRQEATVAEFSALILKFLEDKEMEAQVQRRSVLLEENGYRDDAEYEVKSWNSLVELLAEFLNVKDSETLSLDAYLYYLEEALEQTTGRRIPATGNQVVLGELNTLAAEEVDYLFILSADQKHLPGKGFRTGLLSATDRHLFNHYAEQELLPDSEIQRIYANESHLYALLYLPRQHVQLSFTGAAERQASVVSELIQAEGGTLISHLAPCSLRDPRLALPERAYSYWQLDLPAFQAESQDLSELSELLTTEARQVLAVWEAEAPVRRLSEQGRLRLDPALVHEMLGEAPVWSISQLERYSACPFAYYANNLLRLEERAEWTPDAASYGTLLHGVMEVQQAEWQALLETEDLHPDFWMSLRETLNEEKLLTYFEAARAQDPSLNLFWEPGETFSSRYKAFRSAYYSSLEALHEYGETDGSPLWFPYQEEWSFGPESGNMYSTEVAGNLLQFRGRIDRVDLAGDDQAIYARMIDYKSGQKRVDYADLYYGLDLQLPIYLSAFEALNDDMLAVDAAYQPLSPKIPQNYDLPHSEEKVDQEVAKSLKMSALDLDSESLHLLMRHSVKRASELVQQMKSGDFSAVPRESKKNGALCRFCDFSAVCGLHRGHIRPETLADLHEVLAELSESEIEERKQGRTKQYLIEILQEESQLDAKTED